MLSGLLSLVSLINGETGTGGLLRRANNPAKGALPAAAMEQSKVVSPEHVRLASTVLI